MAKLMVFRVVSFKCFCSDIYIYPVFTVYIYFMYAWMYTYGYFYQIFVRHVYSKANFLETKIFIDHINWCYSLNFSYFQQNELFQKISKKFPSKEEEKEEKCEYVVNPHLKVNINQLFKKVVSFTKEWQILRMHYLLKNINHFI